MRVLVLGSRGFLGKHIIQAVSRRGHEVFTGSRDPTSASDVFADVDDLESLNHAFSEVRPQAVVNCTAYGLDPNCRDPVMATRTNVLGMVAAFRTAERFETERFLHFGTCFEFGSQPLPADESTPLRPHGLYAVSKAAASLLFEELAQTSRVAAVLLRPFVMVGIGERPTKLIPQVLAAARAKEPILLTEGNEVRDYIDVEFVADAAAGLLSIESKDFPRAQSFLLCSGRAQTVREFVQALAHELGASDLLCFGARPSRTDVPACIVGNPNRWRHFARLHPEILPANCRSLSEVIKQLAREGLK